MSSRPRRWKRVRVSGGAGEFGDETEEVFQYVPSSPPPPSCSRQEPLSTTTMILLFVLILIFVCMVALAVALCRMGRIERSLDMMTLIKHMSPVATVPTTAPPSMISGGDYYRPGVPIQLPIPPPYV
jgi:hypothetical protein